MRKKILVGEKGRAMRKDLKGDKDNEMAEGVHSDKEMAEGVHEYLFWKAPYKAEVKEQRSQHWQCIYDQMEVNRKPEFSVRLSVEKDNELIAVRVNKSTEYLNRPMQLFYHLEFP